MQKYRISVQVYCKIGMIQTHKPKTGRNYTDENKINQGAKKHYKVWKKSSKRLKRVLQCCKVSLLEAMALNGHGHWSCSAHVNSRTENTGANITIADNGYMHITGSVNTIVFLFLRNPMTTLKNFNHFQNAEGHT
jgi:hypothetical protein